MPTFAHFNFNVLNLERSLAFYKEALGLVPCGQIDAEDGSFRIVYLSDGCSPFKLELTWLRDRTEPYDLGDEEFHLAFEEAAFETARERHRAMGCICFENPAMGIYFIQDPDGYWLEIVPKRG